MSFFEPDYCAADLEVRVSELLIATADASDPAVDQAVHQVLRLLREQHGMEAGFAAEVIDGKRVSRRLEPSERAQFIDEQAEPLELAFCKQVLRAKVPSGCYVSAPVVLSDGLLYGTLYSFSFNPDAALELRDLKKLEMAAQLAARMIGERRTQRAAASQAQPA
ncbi:hypothetical protein SRS16CHR_01279 [Variovorax sp. SRS16]|uniref:hypothetical protein n=1 Tax=Variovorax sp. SRS16 TaxID=282217 RepID=UPI001315EBFD|nr:hypothetical protein [Variovorax sp. SRS16]VTU14835.1 hypothetical protein SRS16CHR_01279 [Variovorax sp. SRS16]